MNKFKVSMTVAGVLAAAGAGFFGPKPVVGLGLMIAGTVVGLIGEFAFGNERE